MAAWVRPETVFDRAFSPSLQRSIVKIMATSWNEAYRSVRARLQYHAAHDLIGYERRAYIEDNLFSLAKKNRMVRPEPQPNASGTSFHVELVRPPVVLTASAVDHPDQMVRPAKFRNTLARSPQRHLFLTDDDQLPDDPLYGIILYGAGDDQRFPGFVHVAFPDRACSEYVGSIDLMQRFASEYSEHVLRLRRQKGVA